MHYPFITFMVPRLASVIHIDQNNNMTRTFICKTAPLYLLGLLFFAGCSGPDAKDQKNDSAAAVEKGSKGQKVFRDSASLKPFDVYRLENDSIVQTVYIHYLSPKKIVFLISTSNKKTGKSCELSDTALITATDAAPDPSAYSDEADNDLSYPAYEFVYDRDDSLHTIIGVEPSRGKRLKVQTALSELCGPSCPLESVGTLRRTKLSDVDQEGPKLPPLPKQ